MGQNEVYAFLKKNKMKWITVDDIQKISGDVTKSSVTSCLRKLLKLSQVERKRIKGKEQYYVHVYRYNPNGKKKEEIKWL